MTEKRSLEVAAVNAKIAIAFILVLIVFLLMYIAFWK
jgi:hypothetical protein